VNNAYPQKASAAWRIGAGRPAIWLDRQAIHTEMPCPIPARIGVANGDLINAAPAALANNASELNVAKSSRAFSLAAGPISLAPPVSANQIGSTRACLCPLGRVDGVLGWTV